MAESARTYFLTPFVGREDEVRDLRALAGNHRLITLIGPGGAGKTRLGYELFDRLAGQYEGASWSVELAGLSDGALLGHVVADAIGATSFAEQYDPAVLVDHIGERRALLFMDNCEHLAGECAELVAAILARCPNLQVMASSRQSLGLVGEQLYPVPPLSHPDALELFVGRAHAVAPDWTPDDRDRAAIGDICSRLDGMAFAIELAASRMRTTPLEVLGAEIDDQLAALVTKSGRSGRHGSMEACLRWSYDLCTSEERALWARLSVFAGSFTLLSARGVCASPDLPTERIGDALSGLVEKSLIERDVHDPSGRYRMLEVVRQFGIARLAEQDEIDLWRHRHRDHYLALVEHFRAEWWGPDQVAWFRGLRTEQANLRAAFDFSVANRDEVVATLRLCSILEEYVGSTGGISEALRWIRLACAHPTDALAERAEALRIGCFVACLVNALRTAQQFRDDLTLMAMETDDARIRACALYADSIVAVWTGDAAKGAELAQDAIDLFRAVGDIGRVANLEFLRALMLGWAERPDEAADCYRRCLEETRPLGERYWTTYAQWGLGVDLLLAGEVEEAIRLEREAVAAKAAFGDRMGTALALETLCWAAVEQRDGGLAVVLDAAAESIWTWLGVPVGGMPYLVRLRDASRQTLRGMHVPHRDDLAHLGQVLPLNDIVEIAMGRVPVPSGKRVGNLTRRELEIAQLIACGESNQAIADRLVISRRTVESHVERILRKLDISSRTEVRAAL